VYSMARTLGVEAGDLLDFSANINPLGFPSGIRQTILEALETIQHYPDPLCVDLRDDLAEYHGLSPDRIGVGNGSTELIYLLARVLRPKRALVVTPAFSEYERALRLAGVSVRFHATSEAEGFNLQHGLDPAGCDAVYLANPSNPSGALLEPHQLLPILEALDVAGVYTILDEAFVDFVEEASMKTFLGQFPRLIILRSFTKFFGIPGIRLGYAMADQGIISRMEEAREPWSVNALAQALGRACLEDARFRARTRSVIKCERKYLHSELASIDGLRVFPSRANYLLVKLTRPRWSAAMLQGMLLSHRILIRDAGNFRGLDERFFRVAVRLRPENDRLLAAIRNSLRKGMTPHGSGLSLPGRLPPRPPSRGS